MFGILPRAPRLLAPTRAFSTTAPTLRPFVPTLIRQSDAPPTESSAPPAELTPGEQLLFNKLTGSLQGAKIDVQDVSGQFSRISQPRTTIYRIALQAAVDHSMRYRSRMAPSRASLRSSSTVWSTNCSKTKLKECTDYRCVPSYRTLRTLTHRSSYLQLKTSPN